MFINSENSLLLIVDVQEKLVDHIFNKSSIIKNIKTLINIFDVLGLPIIISEQYPKGLGKTIDDITNEVNLETFNFFDKITFSCYPSESFQKILRK